jgi:phytoene dehydrogenase-like protein
MKNSLEGKNILIIGSGIGGLSAGILLAGLNYRVTIAEKNQLPGGLMRSYRRAGIDCPVGVHYVGALGANEPLGRMFSALGLDVQEIFSRMGSEGVIDRYIFDDFSFDLPANIEAYEKNLRDSFPDENQAISVLMNNLREISQRMLDPAFLLNQGDPFQNIDYLQPLGDFLDKLNVSPRLRAVISVPCQLVGVPPAECPLIFHHMVLASYLFSAWRLKDNGAKMTDALVRRFEKLGGKLLLNDGVEKILFAEGKAAGTILKSDSKIQADYVIADIHPKILLQLLENDSLRPSLRQRILDLSETEGVISVQVSVDASAHPQIAHNIYRLHIDQKGEIEDGVFYQVRKVNDKTSLLSIITKSLYVEWSEWEHTFSGRRPKDYQEKKAAIGRELLQKAEVVLGPLKNADIIDIFTPLTIRDYVNCPEGSCYGVMRTARQLLKVASVNNIPIGGLYMTGQNALAPGVMGSILGSFNVVRKIVGAQRFIKDIKW